MYKFDAELAREEAIEWIKSTVSNKGFNKVVIGISGGKDSAVAAALCCRALGNKNVHGLLLPNGWQNDIDDSIEVCKSLGIQYDTINIKVVYDAFLAQYVLGTDKGDIGIKTEGENVVLVDRADEQVKLTEEAKINLPPRIRMAMLRVWGQSHNSLLCGTGNYSEIVLGYCTKDGDTSSDFNPLGRITSIEVVEIGRAMKELPMRVVNKAPADGLTGKSDEDVIGITYIDVHKYIRNIAMDKATWYKIHQREIANLHKRTCIDVYNPSNKVLGGG